MTRKEIESNTCLLLGVGGRRQEKIKGVVQILFFKVSWNYRFTLPKISKSVNIFQEQWEEPPETAFRPGPPTEPPLPPWKWVKSEGNNKDFVTVHRSKPNRENFPGVSWDSLPDELLLRIFTCLCFPELLKVSSVGKRWYHLASDESLADHRPRKRKPLYQRRLVDCSPEAWLPSAAQDHLWISC